MKEAKLYIVLRPILTFLFKVIYKPKIINKENIKIKHRIVLAGNHTHNFDCLALIASTKRPIHFLAKIELFKGPVGPIFRSLGLIPVDRKRKNKEALEKAYQYLNDDKAVCVFPEGTYHKEKGQLLPFKMGAVKMARKTNSMLIPFAIVGKYKRGKMKIIYGKGYYVESDDLEKENEKLKQKVLDLIKSYEV